MKSITFTVDAALLRELGERLVGRPYMALAELAKNSYDADATRVEITFQPDSIEVADDGNGMSFAEFRDNWMRIGSPHKESNQISPVRGRPLTGSKGVGRLAVQLLANRLELRTTEYQGTTTELVAKVDWATAVQSQSLTTAEALWQERPRTTAYPNSSDHGAVFKLTELQHDWTSEAFVRLAQELWSLQPPFEVDDPADRFEVVLVHPDSGVVERFEHQMKAVLELWTARVLCRLKPRDAVNSKGRTTRTAEVLLTFRDGESHRAEYAIDACVIDRFDYEVRVFNLTRRQPMGIAVADARAYLRRYGGVGVYDAGFRLPYYGADSDWLDIGRDAGRRLSRSLLLPEELQVREGLQFLPTNERLFGVVNINTSRERRAGLDGGWPKDALAIQVTRDRLADNLAYRQLRDVVRFGMDFYANAEAARSHRESAKRTPVKPLGRRGKSIDDLVNDLAEVVPEAAREPLRERVGELVDASLAEADELKRSATLLGTLATAGITSLALEHEISKQMTLLDSIATDLRSTELTLSQREDLADTIDRWIEQTRRSRSLFSQLASTTRSDPVRLRLRRLVGGVVEQVAGIDPSLKVDLSAVSDSFRLPPGGPAEWSAVFQNLLFNAANALVDTRRSEVVISTTEDDSRRSIRIEDKGVGVDLSDAERLFEPFERGHSISTERQSLGLGGTGLGLTIVRLIAEQLNVSVEFVEPSPSYSTCVQLSWTEDEKK